MRRCLVLPVLAAIAVVQAAAQLPSREEVLQQVYPSARIQTKRLFLTERQLQIVKDQAGTAFSSALVAQYRLFGKNGPLGRAYIDTHLVRTKRESILVCLDQEGQVLRVETTAFLEPPEYRAPKIWFDQYRTRRLSEGLRLNRDIRPVVGATLTCLAASQAIRRVLALDRLLTNTQSGGGR